MGPYSSFYKMRLAPSPSHLFPSAHTFTALWTTIQCCLYYLAVQIIAIFFHLTSAFPLPHTRNCLYLLCSSTCCLPLQDAAGSLWILPAEAPGTSRFSKELCAFAGAPLDDACLLSHCWSSCSSDPHTGTGAVFDVFWAPSKCLSSE